MTPKDLTPNDFANGISGRRAACLQSLYNELPELKAMKNTVNYHKNSVKHMDSGDDAHIIINAKGEARTMLERAVRNYEKLELPVNPRVERFWNVLAGREQA